MPRIVPCVKRECGTHDRTARPISAHPIILAADESDARTLRVANGEQLAGLVCAGPLDGKVVGDRRYMRKVVRGALFALSLTFAQPHPRASAAVLVDKYYARGF